MAINWRVYGTDTVAAVLDKGELTGFFRQAVVRPNEAALVIRNGSIEEVVTETVVRTFGFRDRLAELLGQVRDAQVILVDTSSLYLDSTRARLSGADPAVPRSPSWRCPPTDHRPRPWPANKSEL